MTAASSSEVDQTRQDIQQTREELGETVAALAAKTDVKARLRGKATATASGLRNRVAQAGKSTKTRVTQVVGTTRHKASQTAKPVTQKAQQTPTAVRDAAEAGARTTREKASQTATSVTQKAQHATTAVRDAAKASARAMRQKASQNAKPVTQKAQQATTAVRDAAEAGARTTSKAESTLVTTARTATTKIGRSIRAKPVPALAVGGTAATLAVALYRHRRPRARKETKGGELMFGAGLGLGYVLGTRAGRERYNQISAKAKEVWESKTVQDAAGAVQDRVERLSEDGKHMNSEQTHQMQNPD